MTNDQTCKHCGTPLVYSGRGRPPTQCASCREAYRVEHQAEWQHASRGRRRKVIRAAKSVPCADCGVQYPPWVMEFDHLGDDKSFTIGTYNGYTSMDTLLAEIAKCEVVCANCHHQRTHDRRLANPGRQQALIS